MATQAFNALTGVSVGSNANLVIDANSNATLANVSGNYYTGNGATFAGNVYTSLINTGLISGALGAGYVASVGTHSATVAYASQYIFGTSDFTIEFWFNPTTLTPGNFLLTGPAIQTNYETDGTIALYISSNGGAWNISEGTLNCTTTVGVWSHIALVRNGTSFKLYKDGVLTSSVTSALGIYNPASTITLVNGVDGRLSNYRIVIGTAVYTAPFTPPNSPLTSIQTANQNGNPSNAITGTQTKLLTFESSSVIDISSYSASITNTSINMVYQDVPFGQPQGTFIYDGNTWQASPINVNGNVSATQFIGGGNLLSNVLTVSQYTTGNFSNIINNVHGLNFDTTTGFSVTDLGGGNALVSLGSSFKTWEVDGQANLVAVGEDVVKFVAGDGMIITTNASAYPQQIEFTANFGGLSTSSISNGNSNVNIATANGNITISSEGNANVVVVSGTGAKVSGSLTVGAGTGGNVTGANVVSANTVTANLVYGNYLQGDGYLISNITISAGSSITNGTSNVLVTINGNVNTSVAGNANVLVVTGTGANVLGTFDATGNISANFFTGNGVNVTGNVTGYNANLGNLVAANYFSGDGGLLSNIGNANYANFAGTAYSVNGANVSGEVANANYSTYGNYTAYSNLASYANTLASNRANYFGVTNNVVAGELMWTKYGNGNTIFDASNSTSPSGTSINNGNAQIAWNNNYPTLMGWNGANTYGVRVDSARIADLANLSTYANIVTDQAQPNITSLGNLTNLVVEGNISSVNIISANNVNANIANVNTINANLLAGNYVSGDGYLLSNLSISGGSSIFNGNSNVVVAANSNVSTSVAGNANVVVVTGTGMNVAGTFNTTGNVNVGNLQIGTAVGGTITGANAIVANFFVGNGALLTGISTSPNSIFNGNSNVNIATANGNVTVSVNNVANVFVVSATGVTANYYSGNGGGLSNIAAANIVGNVANANYANIAGTAYSVAGANVSGNVATANYANYAGTAYSVDGANVSGDVATANYANYAGTAFAIDGANVSNTVANANFALYSNLASFANIVTDAAQPNITSLGNLTELNVIGNTLIAGNLTVDGNITYVNVDQLYITDPIIEMGGSANGDPLTTNDGKDRGTLLYYYNGAPIEAFMGWDNSNSEFILGSNVTNSSDVITVNTYGNVRANVFIGNLSGNANNSNYLNGITSNGLFNNMGLDLTTYNNFNTPNNFGYQYIFGNTNGPNTGGTQFYTVASGIGGDYPYSDYAQQMAINRFTAGGDPYLTVRQKEAGVWGTWTKLYAGYADSANTANYSSNSNYANIIVDNAQPNITSVGTLIDLNVSGNIIAANFTANTGFFTGDGAGLSNINGANVVGNISGNIANANYAEYSNLASFSNTFASNITNYFGATNDAVAGQLMWTKYGNGHTVFDASNSTSPTGTVVDSANATIPWTANYPTLMGWNGSDTYGVRVDSARLSDSATSVNGANITGDVANATYANFAGSAYSVDGANVSGEVANANYATYGNYSEYSNNANYSGTFASNLTNYFTITNNAVAGQLMWSLYGNDHVLFDASNGTSPAGTSINNGDATVIWTNNYPTIMGWNGSDTYGVRVDSSRVADIANSIVAANVTGLGNVALANFDGSSSNVLYGNGVFAPAANLSSISNGTSNVVIDLDGNVSTSVSGNANIFVVTGTGANIAGDLDITSNLTVNGNITITTGVFTGNGAGLSNIAGGNIVGDVANANYANFAGTAYSVDGANIIGEVSNANYASFSNIANVAFSVDLANVVGIGNIASINIDGSSSNVLYGNGVFAPGGGGGSGSSIANGTSNVNIDTVDGNVTTSVSGNANVVIVTGTGINVAGTINTSGNANVGNLNIGTGVGGSLTGANSITANYFIGNGSLLTGISVSSIFNGNSNVIVSANGNVSTSVTGNANVFVVTGNGVNVNGNVNFNYVDTGLVGLANVFGQPTYYGDFTAAPPFGGAYLTVDNNASLFDQNGAFTIECFFYPRDTTGLNLPEYIWNFAFTDGWFCSWNDPNGGFPGNFHVGTQQYGIRITSSDTFNDINQWYHIALSSDGTTTRLFINGVLQGTYAGTGGTIPNPQTLIIALAGNGPYDYAVNGKISNFRFVKDVAVYTENFVVPGGPLPENQLANVNGYPSAAISAGQTSLLTLQDSAINDNSTYALTVTNSGVTTASIDKIWSEGSFTYNGISWYTAQNITANFFIGDGSNISNIAVANVVGIGNVALANFDGNSSNILYGNGVFAPGGTGNGTAIVNGTSNVIVELDGNVSTSVAGNANVFVVTGTGANLNGDLTVVSNVTAANFNGSGAGTPTVTSATNLDLSAPVSVRVVGGGTLRLPNLTDADIANLIGANGDIIYNTTVNTVQAYENGAWANINSGGGGNGTAIVNGNSSVIVSANGNVSTSVAGNANVFVVTDTGANVNGNLNLTGGANVVFSTINTGLTTNIANTLSLSPATYAASFNGTNSGLIVNSTPNSNFIFGTEDFTIECWVYVKEFNGFSQIVGSHIYDVSVDWILAILGTSPAFYSPYTPGGWTYSTDVLTTNTWTHLAFSVISGVGTFYLNGVAAGTATIGGSLNCTIPVSVGRDYSYTANVSFNGLMSNLRVVKGAGVYTTSFTPSTNQLTAIQAANTNGSPSAAVGFGETVLLTLQNSTIIDNSVYAYTFIDNNVAAGSLNGSLLFDGVAWTSTSFAGTFYGTATSASIVTGNAQPNINSLGTLTSLTIAGDQYFPGPGTGLVGGLAGPGYPVGVFDGAGSLLVAGRPLSTGLDSFTLEAWINPKTTTLPYLIHGDTGCIQVGYDSSNQFGLAQSNNNWLLTTTAIDAPKINVWSHIAVVREGIGTDQTKIYVNGVMVAQGTVATNFPDSGMYIGDQFIGDITNLRYVQGIAVYTSNFTPSTTPLTAIQDANVNGNPSAAIPVADGTGFLLQTPNNASYLTDSSYNNSVLSQTGPGVTVSSASGPGSYSGSLYFDGSNQLLTTPSYPGIALGRGQVDWTVEVFVNRDALTQNGLIIQNGGFGYSSPEYSLSIDVNGYVSALVSNSLWGNSAQAVGIGGPNAPSNFPLTIGTWYHLALVRTGSTFSLYIDGTLIASGFIPFEMGDDNYLLQIGAVQPSPYNGGAGFKGYISNIRITRGIALYISTFTPPTAPLQLIQNVDENGSPSASIPTMTGAYTTVLTLQDPTFVDNSEYKFPIIKYGNASIDYVPAPFTTQPITFTYTGNGWYTNGNLAANGNISGNYIYGNGYYLTGISGGSGSNIANGTSNVNIDTADGNVTTSVGGTANVFVVSTTGVTATYYNGDGNGIANIQGSNVSGEVANANYATYAGTAYSVSGANVSGEVANANYATYAGTAYSIDAANVVGLGNVALANFDGSSSNVLYGNGVFAPGGGGGGNGTAIVNGTSNVIVELDGNVSTSVAGNANIFVVTGTGANVNGNLTVTNISNLGNVGNVKITGGANGQILQTDGTGNLNWYNKPSGGTGFIYVYTRTSGAVEVQLVNSVLNIVGRSGNIAVPIS